MISAGSPAHHMKKCLLCVLILLAPAVLRAQDSVRVDHIGLGVGEWYGSVLPTPVRVHIPAVPQAQTLELQFQFSAREGSAVEIEKSPLIPLPNRISKQIQVSANTPLDIELPVDLPGEGRLAIQLSILDSSGRKIGSATREFNSQYRGSENLVAIYCVDPQVCSGTSAQIHANIESMDGGVRVPRIVVPLSEPVQQWWEYNLADSVVIAGPTAQLSAGQREAIEKYLRGGGTLILLEKEIADTSFLTAYRQGAPSSDGIHVGMGRLFRLPSLESKQLGKNFGWGAQPNNADYSKWFGAPEGNLDHFLHRVGTSFTFPHLRWLIIWLSVFVVVIGPLNFIILHRLKKLEWGWITTCVISVLFAGGLYFANSVRRPADFTLDDTVVYWMDSQSSTAFAQYGFRVYSPERRVVALSVAHDDVFLQPNWDRNYGETAASIGSEMLGNHAGAVSGWRQQIGPPKQLEFPMLRWSYQDFHASNFRDFPGTVHLSSPTHLKNDTGQSFSEVILLDYKANLSYSIPRMAPGEEIDLNKMRAEYIVLPEEERKRLAAENPQGITAFSRSFAERPFSVQEMPTSRGGSAASQIFVGWADAPMSNAKLDVPFVQRPHGALVIVLFDQK
jgi:hypothetical protein